MVREMVWGLRVAQPRLQVAQDASGSTRLYVQYFFELGAVCYDHGHIKKEMCLYRSMMAKNRSRRRGARDPSNLMSSVLCSRKGNGKKICRGSWCSICVTMIVCMVP